MKSIEFGSAEPLPDWKRWDIEGLSGEECVLTTPEGRVYHLSANEKLLLEPIEPTGDLMPKAFIIKDGNKIPFEEWEKLNR